jgi:hypothetical protein
MGDSRLISEMRCQNVENLPTGQGAACKALTPGSGPLATGGEAVVLEVGDQGEEVW